MLVYASAKIFGQLTDTGECRGFVDDIEAKQRESC